MMRRMRVVTALERRYCEGKHAQRYSKTEYIKINISKAAVADKNPSSSQKTHIVKYIISKMS